MTAIPPPTNPDGSELKQDPMVKPPPNLFSQRWFQIAAPIWVVLGGLAIAMGETDEEERQKLGLKVSRSWNFDPDCRRRSCSGGRRRSWKDGKLTNFLPSFVPRHSRRFFVYRPLADLPPFSA